MSFSRELNLKSKESILIFIVLASFFIVQFNYINTAGTTYDADGLRFGSNIIIEKIKRISSFNFNFSDLPFSDVEYYGMLVILPAYIFAQLFKRFFINPTDLGFENIDGVIYYLMNFYLIVYVVVCLYFIYKKVRNINPTTSLIFILILIMTPSFSGHSLFNLKDIPYALQFFLFSLFFSEYIQNYLNNNYEKMNFKLGILLGLLLAVRLNGILFAFLIISIGTIMLIISKNSNLNKFFTDMTVVLLIGFALLYLLTPSAWISPIEWIENAIYQQFFLEWSGSTLTNGEFIIATEMKWYYLLIWFFFKLPIFFHISVLLYIYVKFKKIKLNILSDISAIFIISVFLIFSIFKPSVYDGIRQFLFLLPFFALFATDTFIKFFKYKNINLYMFLIPTILYFSFTQFGLGAYKYVYFNEFVDVEKVSIECNNVDGCGNWPSDYWGFSGREVATYLNNNLLEGDIPNNAKFAWKNNSTSLLICRPNITVDTYLDKNMNYNKLTFGDFSRNEIITTTFHRPRYMDDSCKFLINEIDYNCSTIYSFSKNIRFSTIELAHIKECKI